MPEADVDGKVWEQFRCLCHEKKVRRRSSYLPSLYGPDYGSDAKYEQILNLLTSTDNDECTKEKPDNHLFYFQVVGKF